MQILLADDNPVFLQALERFLSTDSRIRQLHLARSGAEAIELADRENPDLVLLDWSLPDRNGLLAALRILDRAEPPEVWVLAPYDHPEFERAARAAGAAGCLSRQQFIEKIEPLLQDLQDRRSPVGERFPASATAGSASSGLRPPAGPSESAATAKNQNPVREVLRDLELFCSQQRAGLEKIEEAQAAPRRPPETASRERDALYLLCRLAGDCFGLPLGRMARVEKTTIISPLPPEYTPVSGLVFFEGAAVPVMYFSDIRGDRAGSKPEDERLVILRSGRSLAGLMVEGVEEVIPVPASAQWPLPRPPVAGPRSYLTRIARHKDRFIFLLDVDKIMIDLNGV